MNSNKGPFLGVSIYQKVISTNSSAIIFFHLYKKYSYVFNYL